MRVSLIEQESGSILIDATSIDDNEGVARLDYTSLSYDTMYVLKYEFFEQQIVSSNSELSQTQFSTSNTECKLPFILQELLIIDSQLAKSRI